MRSHQVEVICLACVQAFPPMNMYGLAFTQKAAGLYGLKSSAQGSGRKRFVIVKSTNRTQPLAPEGQERLRDMLAAHESALDLLRPESQAAAVSRGEHPPKLACSSQGGSHTRLWYCAWWVQCTAILLS